MSSNPLWIVWNVRNETSKMQKFIHLDFICMASFHFNTKTSCSKVNVHDTNVQNIYIERQEVPERYFL
jgi:hypothetical protein